tara:strand:- start:382 stop:1644 length:1263 start_codon:yes stop_codon:yes gene_type:complete
MARMSKEMPLKVFAKKVGIDKKEQEWIEKNDKETHYVNNSALKNSWLSLSYPIYDGDYYFAFINKKARVNAQYNAKANRELRKYIKSFLNADEIFERMEKYFAMQFKDAGSGDTMTREELWTAIVDMRRKNPAPKKPTNESNLQEVSLDNNMMQRHFANVWSSKDAKLYRVLSQLISQDGFVDNMKAYKKNPKDYLNRLKDIAKNPKKYTKSFGPNFPQYINNPKPGQNYAKLPESINEVTDKEINMAKKLSKDMEKVKKGYQQIAKSGDKTLKNTGFNPTYEAILKAQQKVLSLIGELNTMKMMSDRAASRKKDAQGRPIMNSFDIMDTYRDMHDSEHCELVEGKVLKFTKVKDKSLEKHLKVVTKKVGAKLEKISGGFQVSDTDMKGFTAVVDYIFDKSIKKNMLDGGGMSDVTMVGK